MQRITATNSHQLKGLEVVVTPRKKPIIAKGNAKIEWANSTNEKYFFMYG
ncbi:hypothetical protein PBAL39_06601 [Pedobacter sp. BAL39]|nr:hypothetical protein PBAL39_06601 [Pedobacter sp. BAL39]